MTPFGLIRFRFMFAETEYCTLMPFVIGLQVDTRDNSCAPPYTRVCRVNYLCDQLPTLFALCAAEKESKTNLRCMIPLWELQGGKIPGFSGYLALPGSIGVFTPKLGGEREREETVIQRQRGAHKETERNTQRQIFRYSDTEKEREAEREKESPTPCP